MLDANHDGRDTQELAANCAEHKYHTYERAEYLPFEWDVKTGTFDKGWTVEMALPFDQIAQYETLSKTMGVNFMRWSTDTGEEQTWSPCDSFPDNARRFGTMKLSTVQGTSPVSKAYQRNPSFTISELKLEENGPVKAVVCIRGAFDDQGQNEFPTTMRIYAYKGLPLLRVVHSFVFGGKPWEDFVRTYGLRLNLAKSLGTLKSATYSDSPPANKDGMTIWDISSAKAGVSVAMQWARRLRPKDVVADADKRTLNCLFYPGPAIMDLRRTARHSHWKYYTSTEWSCATGLALTNEVFLDFHAKSPDAKRAAALGGICDQQSVPLASPEYNCSTLAFGRFVPAQKGDLEKLETRLQRYLDMFRRAAKLYNWDGMFDWGDYRYHMNPKQGTWPLGSGLWAWVNGEGKMTSSYFFQYLRTGEKKYFDWAEVMTRHSSEIDLIHYGKKGMSKYVGSIHRHNSCHWNGQGETRYTPHHGWALYYFLTGDMRIFDIFEKELRVHLVELPMNVWYADYGSRAYYHMRFWEMTNRKDYRDRIEWFMKQTLKHQKPDGKVPFYAASNWLTREYAKARGHGNVDYLQTYGFIYALVEYYDLTGDEEILKGFLDYIKGIPRDRLRKFIGYGAGRASLGSYFRLTGDEAVRKAALNWNGSIGFDGLFPKEIAQMSDAEVDAAMRRWPWNTKTVHPFYIIAGIIRSLGELTATPPAKVAP